MITTETRMKTLQFLYGLTSDWKYCIEVEKEMYVFSARIEEDYIDKAKQILFNICWS